MAMKEATIKKRAAAKLRKAYKLMNNAGEHWIQGYMAYLECPIENPEFYEDEFETFDDQRAVEKDPKQCQFCAVGGLRMAIFGTVEPNEDEMADPVYNTALAALVATTKNRKTVDLDGFDVRVTPGEVGVEIQETKDYYRITDPLEYSVMSWNDYGMRGAPKQRTWRQVEAGFLKAAASLEA